MGSIGIAGMLGAAVGQWLGARGADRTPPVRLLARAAAAQALGLAATMAIVIFAHREVLAGHALCLVGVAIAAATAVPAGIASGAATKLLLASVPGGAAGDFACIGTISSLLGLGLATAAGAAAMWLQAHEGHLPAGIPAAAPLLALAALTACAAQHLLQRRAART